MNSIWGDSRASQKANEDGNRKTKKIKSSKHAENCINKNENHARKQTNTPTYKLMYLKETDNAES